MGLLPGSDSNIERLTIEAYKKVDCSGDPYATFVAQVNPQNLVYTFGVEPLDGGDGGSESADTLEKGLTAPAPPTGFRGYKKMTLKFDFLADATGILPIPDDMKSEFESADGGGLFGGKPPSIRGHLDKLQNVVYGLEAEIHGPPHVAIIWGKIIPDSSTDNKEKKGAKFKGQLKECVVDIKLFSVSGEPIKAKISLEIESQVSPDAWPSLNSPDVTHNIDIQYGDKMTVHCNEIYGRYDSNICSAIANYNGLIDWDLQQHVGKKLVFPSIHMLNELYLEEWSEINKKKQKEKEEEVISHYDYMEKLIGKKRAKQYFNTFDFDPQQPYKEWESKRAEQELMKNS